SAPLAVWPRLIGVTMQVLPPVRTMKLLALTAIPFAVITLIGPVFAPGGTVALSVVVETKSVTAFTPLNFTTDDPVKFVPVIVITVPTVPLPGVRDVIDGPAGIRLKVYG